MNSFDVWREYFHNWPEGVPRAGLLVTSGGDQIPFIGYLANETMLLLERNAPDSAGARKVLLPYHEVAAVKFTDVLKAKPFLAAGFQGKLPK